MNMPRGPKRNQQRAALNEMLDKQSAALVATIAHTRKGNLPDAKKFLAAAKALDANIKAESARLQRQKRAEKNRAAGRGPRNSLYGAHYETLLKSRQLAYDYFKAINESDKEQAAELRPRLQKYSDRVREIMRMQKKH